MKRPYFASRNHESRASRAGSGGVAAGRSCARALPTRVRKRTTAIEGFMSPPGGPPRKSGRRNSWLYYWRSPSRARGEAIGEKTPVTEKGTCDQESGAPARRSREPVPAAPRARGPRLGRALRSGAPRARVRRGLLVDPGRVGEPTPARGAARRGARDAGRRAVDAGPVRAPAPGRRGRRPPEPDSGLGRGAEARAPAGADRGRDAPSGRGRRDPGGPGAAAGPARLLRRPGHRGGLERGRGRADARVPREGRRPPGRPRARRPLVGEGRREGARGVVPGGGRARPSAGPRRVPERRHGERGEGGSREAGGRLGPPGAGTHASHRLRRHGAGGEGDGRSRRARGHGRDAAHDASPPWRSSGATGTRKPGPTRSFSTPPRTRPWTRWARPDPSRRPGQRPIQPPSTTSTWPWT